MARVFASRCAVRARAFPGPLACCSWRARAPRRAAPRTPAAPWTSSRTPAMPWTSSRAGGEIQSLQHRGPVISAAFSPDGTRGHGALRQRRGSGEASSVWSPHARAAQLPSHTPSRISPTCHAHRAASTSAGAGAIPGSTASKPRRNCSASAYAPNCASALTESRRHHRGDRPATRPSHARSRAWTRDAPRSAAVLLRGCRRGSRAGPGSGRRSERSAIASSRTRGKRLS